MSSTRPPRKPSYPRTFPGLIAAMLVVVLVTLGFIGFRGIFRDNPDAPPIRAAEWKPWFDAARQDQRIAVLEPAALPEGWFAKEARYGGGLLRVALSTDSRRFVGLYEADQSLEKLVEQYVDDAAVPGDAVTIAGATWQTWTDAGGDYAVGRTAGEGRTATSYLVVGTAPEKDVRAFAASLE